MQSKTITSFWWVDHKFNILSFTSTKQKITSRCILKSGGVFFCFVFLVNLDMTKLTSPKPPNRQASLVSNEGLRGNLVFSSPTQFTIRCIFFFFFISSMTSPPFPELSFTSSGGHTEQQIECPLNINSGLELKNISSNVPSSLRLGDLLLQQQVVNLWHYCIFPPIILKLKPSSEP